MPSDSERDAPDVAAGHGGGGAPGGAGEDAHGKPAVSRAKAIVGGVVTVGVLVLVFVGIIPKFADYSEAWTAISTMSIAALAVLAVTVVMNILVYPTPQVAVTPTIGYGDAFTSMWTRFTISNTIPGVGGALGLGIGFEMLRSFGLPADSAAASMAMISTWNTFVTLALPVPAALLYAVFDHGADTGRFLAAGAAGAAIVAVAVVVLAKIISSEHFARRLGETGDRAVSWLLRLLRRDATTAVSEGVLRFRGQIAAQAVARWHGLTWASLAAQLASFVVFWAAARGAGIADVSVAEMFAAFALSRLASFIPVTPGGLGTVDAALIGLLTGFGASSSDALAADLLWRAGTYFVPLFVGAASWVVWRVTAGERAPVAASGDAPATG